MNNSSITILKGKYEDKDILVLRILLIHNEMPFDFKRLQYLVWLTFSMSINKSIEQSLSVGGINLEKSIFSS